MFFANRANRIVGFTPIVNNQIAAVRTLFRPHFFGFNHHNMPALARNLSLCEERCRRLIDSATNRAFNQKFSCHILPYPFTITEYLGIPATQFCLFQGGGRAKDYIFLDGHERGITRIIQSLIWLLYYATFNSPAHSNKNGRCDL